MKGFICSSVVPEALTHTSNPLVHSLASHNGQGWFRLKPAARHFCQASDMGSRGPHVWDMSTAFPSQSVERQIGREAAGTQTITQMGNWNHTCSFPCKATSHVPAAYSWQILYTQYLLLFRWFLSSIHSNSDWLRAIQLKMWEIQSPTFFV